MTTEQYLKEKGISIDGSKEFNIKIKVPKGVEWLNDISIKYIELSVMYSRKRIDGEMTGVYTGCLSGITNYKKDGNFIIKQYEPLNNVYCLANSANRASKKALQYAVMIALAFTPKMIVKLINNYNGVLNTEKVDELEFLK